MATAEGLDAPKSLTVSAAAAVLAGDGLSPTDVKHVLHVLGFQGDTPNLLGVLTLATELSSRFKILRDGLPPLAPLIDKILLAPGLLQRAHCRGIEAGSQLHPLCFSEISGPVGELLRAYSLQQPNLPAASEGLKDLLTVLWILTLLQPDPDLDRIQRRAGLDGRLGYGWLFPYCERVLANLATGSELVGSMEGLGVFRWIRVLHRQRRRSRRHLRSPYLLLYSWVNCIRKRIDAQFLFSNEDSVPTPSYLELNERYLSRNNWYYPRPTELRTFRQIFRRLEKADEPNFIPTLVISLALVTCRTVEEALYLPVSGYDDPSFAGITVQHPSVFSNYGRRMFDTRHFAVWKINTSRARNGVLVLSLPELISKALRRLVDYRATGCLRDLLPSPWTDWKDRIEAYGAELLGCTRSRLNHLLRDTLLRTAYAQTSNRALLLLLASHRKRPAEVRRGQLLALSHYLHPESPRNWDAYRTACEEILGTFGEKVGETSCDCVNPAMTVEEHRVVATFLRDRIPIDFDIADLVTCHNTYAAYVLSLLLAATGHRRSRTPFFFPWDICLDEKLVFVSDKAIVGSEARFIPLADAAAQQVHHYYLHLAVLRRLASHGHPKVAQHIDSLIRVQSILRGSDVHPPTRSGPVCGLLFRIDREGNCQPFSTSDIDRTLKLAGLEPVTRRFRPAIAEALWSTEHSGTEVAAFLGHADELHPFGPASAWAVVNWAAQLRPHLDTYLQERTWIVTKSPLFAGIPRNADVLPAYPSHILSHFSYEGRLRSKRQARARAIQVIQSVLSEERLSDGFDKLDERAVKQIRNRIDELLSGDENARAQVLRCLSVELKRQHKAGAKLTAPTINLLRTDPSPVELSFGRHLGIASCARQIWQQRVGKPIDGRMDALERAAQLAISLVIFEGVLNPRAVQEVVSAALAGCDIHPDALVIRARLTNDRFVYEFAHVADTVVTALALGLSRRPQDENPSWTEIQERIEAQLNKILGRRTSRASWHLSDLCLLFRPWWFIRLPGALYSIALGNHNGPAPSRESEFALLGVGLPIESSPNTPLSIATKQEIPKAEGQKDALAALHKLMRSAHGELERGTAHTRRQRAQLAKSVKKEKLDPNLAAYMTTQPIVDALVSFIEDLRTHGGRRADILKFNSIKTYLSRICEVFIDEAWDAEIELWDASEFEDFYRRVRAKRLDKQSSMLIAMFHQHLRDKINAPYVASARHKSVRQLQRCRSIILTASTISKAFSTLSSTSNKSSAELRRTAQALLSLYCGYGLRYREALGLTAFSFDKNNLAHLKVERNVIRDLKTGTLSRRVIPDIIPGANSPALSSAIKSAQIAPGSDRYVFASTNRTYKIKKTSDLHRCLIAVLRASSGNRKVVLHDIRHTYATRLALGALFVPRIIPSSLRARNRLGPLDRDAVVAMTRTPDRNPFLIDGVAQLLGHSSVDTLLNVYFNGSCFALAEHVAAINQHCRFSDAQLAGMLDKDRSTITHQRERLDRDQPDRTAASRPDDAELVAHYLNRMTAGATTSIVCQSEKSEAQKYVALEWALLDKLLCERKQVASGFDDLEAQALEDGLDPVAVYAALNYYRDRVVGLCGFADFEPDKSELIRGRPSHGSGVIRGQKEREASIAEAQRAYYADMDFRNKLHAMVHRWESAVDSDNPWFVARDAEELDAIRAILARIGMQADQVEIRYAGPVGTALYENCARIQESPRLQANRLSRGPRHVRVSEAGINIRQKAGSRLGDGRDTHRLLAILACCVAAERALEAESVGQVAGKPPAPKKHEEVKKCRILPVHS